MDIQRRQYAKPIPRAFKKKEKDQEHFLRLFFGVENQERASKLCLTIALKTFQILRTLQKWKVLSLSN
jgi:hypothetical protein